MSKLNMRFKLPLIRKKKLFKVKGEEVKMGEIVASGKGHRDSESWLMLNRKINFEKFKVRGFNFENFKP